MGAIEMHRPTRSEPANRIKNDLEGKARRVQPEEANISRFHFLYLVFFLFFFSERRWFLVLRFVWVSFDSFRSGNTKENGHKTTASIFPTIPKGCNWSNQQSIAGAGGEWSAAHFVRKLQSTESDPISDGDPVKLEQSKWWLSFSSFSLILWFVDSLILSISFFFWLVIISPLPFPPPNPNQFWKSIRIETSQEGRRGWKSGEINQIRRIW